MKTSVENCLQWNRNENLVKVRTFGGVDVEDGEYVGRLVDRRLEWPEVLPPEAWVGEGIGGYGDRD